MADLHIGVLTCSDSRAAGAEDFGGRALIALAEQRGWMVVSYHVSQDDRESIAASLIEMCDAEDADVVFTCGGTALGPRDVTPDATLDIAEREIRGIASAVRQELVRDNPHAILTRAVCAQRGRTIIVNLPGGEHAVRIGFNAIADQMETASAMTRGRGNT